MRGRRESGEWWKGGDHLVRSCVISVISVISDQQVSCNLIITSRQRSIGQFQAETENAAWRRSSKEKGKQQATSKCKLVFTFVC